MFLRTVTAPVQPVLCFAWLYDMEIVPDDKWTENDDAPLFVDGEMCLSGRTFWEHELSHELESGRKKGQVWYLVNMTCVAAFPSKTGACTGRECL